MAVLSLERRIADVYESLRVRSDELRDAIAREDVAAMRHAVQAVARLLSYLATLEAL